MNLNKVKNYIKNMLFEEHVFVYKGVRNQVEKFRGKINNCYSGIFIIELSDGRIKSFSYNDVIMGNLIVFS